MCGNYQVIIQEFLYYVKEIDKQQTNIIVKYDISKKEKIYEKKLDQSFILNNKPSTLKPTYLVNIYWTKSLNC